MLKKIALTLGATALTLGVASAPATAASHVTPSYHDTNWPCAGC